LGDGFDGIFGGYVFFHGVDYSIDWLFFGFVAFLFYLSRGGMVSLNPQSA
jgi:hypothetical protein